MKLNFKHWAESYFGSAGPGIDDMPASEFPMQLNKIQNGAFPSYNAPENDQLMAQIKEKYRKQTKKQKKR